MFEWFMDDVSDGALCDWQKHVWGKDLKHVLVPGEINTCQRCGLTATVT